MAIRNGNDIYKNNQILTASPKRLIELLYEGAIKNLKIAELLLEKNEFNGVNTHIMKAEDIILELKQSINSEVEGDIPQQLNDMYDFMFGRLVEGNLEKNRKTIQLVRSMLEELKETWASI
ncbi:flagellar export chaperone FliS [Vagococcus sp. BWB3-3]|uniref:Flagellar export chaperone FliS n=1 Tax=Vagococcus allomyrinae TaxID=2794353 RepID=A0A940PDK5_9ENTE|nr:flagellar export chaperone FliS [Vagococcus allomyrinae]MBP1042003.1 flagellar export chaperone FliS [Vagococcus allomyrinae]